MAPTGPARCPLFFPASLPRSLSMSTPAFWQSCLESFQRELTQQQFNTWIRPLRLELAGEGLCLIAPNRFVLQWVKDRFAGRIEELAAVAVGRPLRLAFVVADAAVRAAPASAATHPTAPEPKPVAARRGEQASLNPGFTFDTFVSGKANQLARAGGLQVAEHPTSYNPLFVYGGVGLGKTHLIQAIGNHILENNPNARIRYIHAETYVSDVVRAYQHKAFDDFKRHYRSLDLLLIDDIQFFSGKSRTQEEFFYLFNTLIEAHKQVVITCDTYPKEIAGIEERLISRFGWGLTVALSKELTQLSLPEIGSNFGGRDHTTVLHACRQIAKLRDSLPEMSHDVNFLLQVLRN